MSIPTKKFYAKFKKVFVKEYYIGLEDIEEMDNFMKDLFCEYINDNNNNSVAVPSSITPVDTVIPYNNNNNININSL